VGKPRRTIEARRLFAFTEVIGDRHLINVTVGPRLEPVVLSLAQAPDYRIEEGPDRPSFPKKRADRPNGFRIHHQAGGVWRVVDIPATVENFYHVQPLKEDGWLLVRSRADGDDDRNAHVYDAAGRHVRSFHAGDGSQDVQVTENGQIWVSYFDEGVFSDTNLGNSGLVRLDTYGDCTFRYPGAYGVTVPGIADCYALNVASNRDVWLYYYTDFPLVKLVDEKPESIWHKIPIKGSSGFAIDGDKVLFVGGYKDRGTLHLVRLNTLKTETFRPVDESGQPVERLRCFGRGHRLFLQTEDALYAVAVP
jgi:hypothetical protein